MEKEKKLPILKCIKCGREYIYDVISKTCPECGGKLEKTTTEKY